jgi:speckle-type POZ protein
MENDPVGKARAPRVRATTRHTFAPASQSGLPRFIEKSRLRSLNSSLSNGYFTVRCVVTVIEEPRTGSKRNLSAVPPPELPGDLERSLKDGRGADVTLGVGGRVFSAHRFILAARSPVFKAELSHPTTANKVTQHLEVVDMEPDIFEMLLHFVYTDSLPPCNVDQGDYGTVAMQYLLVAADRYRLDRLKMICEEKLCRRIDLKTVLSMLAVADRHCCKRLKDACKAFISLPDVMGAVVMSDGFKGLTAAHCLGRVV